MENRRLIPLVLLVAILAAGIGAYTATVFDDGGAAQAQIEPSGIDAPQDINASVYRNAYTNLMDSVVSIRVTTARGTSQGTGFVYDGNGHIVTNQHVVRGSDSVQVMFRRGEWREAEVVGTDVYSDLAVLGVDDVPGYAEPLPVAESDPKPGEVVMALGNPFGLQETITHGIVSGVNRTMGTAGDFTIPDTVQTDAPINPGNSGGPLVDTQGRVVGVNRAKQGDNIGFAISPQIVNRVVPSLIEDGDYRHPYLGVSMTEVTPTIADAMNLEKPRGVMVASVIEGGPSEGVLQGGEMRARTPAGPVRIGGDVIVAIGDRSIDSPQDLSSYLATRTRPGDTVEVTVIRDGERRTVEVELGSRPEPGRRALYG